MIGMNLDRWNKLTKEQQDLLIKAGEQTERDTAKFGDEVLVSENKKLADLGVQVQQLPPDKGKQIQALFNSSNWELASQCCGDAAKELQEIARKANLAD
jgi:TRAP-type C4-dicarboxylate transport system substrate-binding protein